VLQHKVDVFLKSVSAEETDSIQTNRAIASHIVRVLKKKINRKVIVTEETIET
jgi:hypothetical protein